MSGVESRPVASVGDAAVEEERDDSAPRPELDLSRPRDFDGRVLLIQVRDRDAAEAHERICFVERLGIAPDRLRAVNVVRAPVPPWDEIRRHHLVILGGAGAHSATEDHPFTEPLIRLIKRIVDAGRPFLGSCYGHQLMTRALGGTVVVDPAQEEIGTFDIELTPEGSNDPLFGSFPGRFPVHLGHHDRVEDLPEDFVSLAFSERCLHQAIRVGTLPIYGTQFHAEMSAQHMRERLRMYADSYLRTDDPWRLLEEQIRPTEAVEQLLRRYIRLYLAEPSDSDEPPGPCSILGIRE